MIRMVPCVPPVSVLRTYTLVIVYTCGFSCLNRSAMVVCIGTLHRNMALSDCLPAAGCDKDGTLCLIG